MLKNLNGFKIVGINLLAFVLYSIMFILAPKSLIGFGLFYFIHLLICITITIDTKNWYWLLSGLIILIIGISICVNISIIHVGLPPSHK